MNKSPQYNQQSKSEVKEICIYQKMESGRHREHLKINSGFNATKNPKQQYLKVVTPSDPSFNKKSIYVYNHAAYITHTGTDHLVHEKVLISCKN